MARLNFRILVLGCLGFSQFAACQVDLSESLVPGTSVDASGTSTDLTTNHVDFLLAEVVSNSVLAQNSDLNPTSVKMFNSPSFDTNDDGIVEEDALRSAATSYFGANYNGIIVIDWEGAPMNALKSNIGSAAQIAQVQEYVKAIQILKSACPRAKVGIYALPWRQYWNRDAAWRSANDALAPIIDASDAVFPSIYEFYEEGVDQSITEQSEKEYVQEVIEESLRLARGKPVYPFVTHRYHPSNARLKNRTVSSVELRRDFVNALNTRYQGARPAGLLWWAADHYYASIATATWNVSQQPYYDISIEWQNAFSFDKNSQESYTQYVDRIHQRVFDDFRSAFRDAGLKP